MIQFLQLKENVKQQEYTALWLRGSDRWLKLKSLSVICDAYQIVDDGFGVERLDEPTFDDIKAACGTFSMFCPKKLIVCQDFNLPQGKGQLDVINKLSTIICNGDGSFCLVFMSDTPGLEKVAGLETVNCEKLDSENIIKWIVAYGKKQGVTIDGACARKICEYCLQDMSRVSTETQKLIDYGEVSLQSVDLLVHKDTEFVIFDLSVKIAAKNAQGALECYKGLIAAGEDARGMFGLLYNTYRRAYYVKTAGDISRQQLADLLKVKPFAVQKAQELAEKYKPMQLKRILDLFEAADKKLKLFLDETEVMTDLIMQLVAL